MKIFRSTCVKALGLILFFGLCIAMRNKEVSAFAAEGEAKLNVTSVSIIKDGTYGLRVYNLTEGQTVSYRSNDTEVATVSANGEVRGISLGTAVVTATVLEDETPVATLKCDVLIGPAAISIKFTKSEVILPEGGSRLLNTIIIPLNTVEDPVFYTTDPDKVSVSSAGRVRAKEAGVVQVYAFLANQQATCCNVIVLKEDYYKSYSEGRDLAEILDEVGFVIEDPIFGDTVDDPVDDTDPGEETEPGVQDSELLEDTGLETVDSLTESPAEN